MNTPPTNEPPDTSRPRQATPETTPYDPAESIGTYASICNESIYMIPTCRGVACTGSGMFPRGMECPLYGDVGASNCSGRYCTAPEDGRCQMIKANTWGCVFPLIMDAFRSLQVGASFNSKRFEKDIKLFKNKNGPTGTGVTNTNIGAVDFFGFDKKTPIATKKVAAPPPRKDRSASMDVPLWAGAGEVAPVQKEGSKQRRKRKLSEDALAEAVVSDQDRKAVSQLLVPTTSTVTTSPKSKKKHRKKRTQRTASQDLSGDSDDDDDDNDTDDMTVFGKPTSTETSATTPHEPKAVSHADDIKALRRRLNITVEGTVVPDPILEFAQMRTTATALKTVLLRNIEDSQYKNPTPIQMQSIPSILKQRDVLGIAPTGSGKTAAFAIPMLLNLGAPDLKGIRSIVLVPTRELAVQIHGEFQRLALGRKFHIVLLSKASAATITSHSKTCTVNYDVVIATPLRLVHLITNDNVKLDSVEMICLDEADRLFDMGFVEQIDDVFAACTNPKMQRMMFSATMLQGVEEMAQSVLKDPIKISIGTKNAGATTINQKLMFVGKEEGKLVAMKQLIQEGLKLPVLLFVQNKDRAKQLYQELVYDGINVGAIHADRTKEQRDKVIKDFRTGTVWVLICTDLMSRGIDFKGVNMVINYDFPQSAVSYIHRIGRTGRNGRQGEAVTLFTENDMVHLRTIANVMKLSGCDVPAWMLNLKKASMRQRKQLLKAPPERYRIETVSGYDLQKANKRRSHRLNILSTTVVQYLHF
ncbi:hypothetical protein, variant [Aphanomyces astaci]|uniref:RNA helicase n=1 Tax=Aphanomyces astaci TaxID=112090 RepID=W4G1E8_APHAT|nr:hypothetical protein, variant [Aphanomyces astaci]ETV72874.1 hypothetical protein, variant [Aphanomyces astaci]|eukprot:XP_009837660.1 hypothetical protein, variant [Aphanomyces astaci]